MATNIKQPPSELLQRAKNLEFTMQRMKQQEKIAIYHIERKNKRDHSEIYIALEEVNFLWTPKEVGQFDEMWKKGVSIVEMAKTFKPKRKPLEVVLLMMDRELRKKIQPRPGGLFGNEKGANQR